MSQSGYISEKPGLSLRQNSNRKSTRNGQVKSCMFRIPWQSETSPIELVKDLAERVTNALRLISPKRSLHQGSSSLSRSKSTGSSIDSHRTAAVEDCIEFIHSSFSRSNSSTAAPRQDSIQAPWVEMFAIMCLLLCLSVYLPFVFFPQIIVMGIKWLCHVSVQTEAVYILLMDFLQGAFHFG